jgi:hypothetical protein
MMPYPLHQSDHNNSNVSRRARRLAAKLALAHRIAGWV